MEIETLQDFSAEEQDVLRGFLLRIRENLAHAIQTNLPE
jgi:hypothetical protein